MKRILYWLAAIAIIMALVWGLRAYFLSRLSYQPDWYREQQKAGAELPPLPDLNRPATAQASPEITPMPSGKKSAPATDRTSRAAAPESGHAGRTSDSGRRQQTRPSASASGQASRAAAEVSGRVAQKETQLQRQLRENASVRIAAADLVPLMLEEIRGTDEFDPRTVVRGAKTILTPNHMVVEMILDLRKFPKERLTPEGLKIFDKVRSLIPENTLNEVYVKGDLRPEVVGEQLLFSKASTVSVGKLTINLEQLEKKFNIQPRVDLNHFDFRQLNVEQDYLVLQR